MSGLVTRQAGHAFKLMLTKMTVPMVEIVFLGPLGPFMCQLALDSVTTAAQLPAFVQALLALESPKKMPGFALGAARRFWGNMRLRRKLLTVYGVLHQLNAPSRRKERINRAAGIMAMRRLNGEGVHRILAALQDPALFKMCMPTSLVEDQDWVQLTESWTESFTREQELTPWLNKILMVMWPFLNEIIAQVVEQMVEPLIQEQLTPDVPITRVEFTTFSLGTIAPQIAGMYVHDTDPTYPDQCTMDLVVSWRGDPDIVIAVTGGRSLANRTFNVALTNLEFQGKFRICIKPLLNVLPCIGGMNLMLVSEPYINYELRLKGSDGSAGMNLDRIPLLKTVVIKIIQGLISDVLLFPNCVPIAIATDSAADEPGTLEKSLEMQSIGELHVKVKYAKELPAADFGGKSDPYLCLALGLSSKSVTFKMMQKTRVIKKTVNPEWNEEIVLKVYDRKLQKLVVRVFDEDLLESDDLLGELTLMINEFQPGVTTQNVYQLRGPNGLRGPAGKERPFGEVALDITFVPGEEFKKRAHLAKLRASGIHNVPEHTAPVGKFPLPVVGALVDWFVYNSSNASELQNIFKEKVAATLHQTYYKGILTDYLLRDKGDLSAFSDAELRAMGRTMPIVYGVHGGLPTWAFNPDFSTMQNIDQLVLQVWPRIGTTVNHLMTRFSNEELNKRFVPSSMQKLVKLSFEFNFGEIPPYVECVRVYPGKDCDMLMEMNIKVAGDQVVGGEVEFAHSPLCKMKMVMSQMQFVGSMRFRLRPLVPLVPIIAGMSVSMMGRPMLDASATLKLSPLLPAFDFCAVPGFRIMRSLVVNYAIKPLMIHPCAIHVPILDMTHPAVAYHLQSNQKVAHVLLINIAEARNLQQADGGLAGASDPYAVIVHSGAGTFGARYLRSQTIQDTLDPTWNFRCEVENKDRDLSMVLGVFDSDVSAATEAAQTAKLKKKKNTREYEVGTDPRLKRTLAVLEEENKLCMEVSAKYKLSVDEIPFSEVMMEYIIRESPPDKPPSTFKRFKLGVLSIIEQETKSGLNQMPYTPPEATDEAPAEAHGGHFKEAVEKVIDTQPPKHIATIVEQTIAGGKKEKTDLEFLLKQEVVGNGNDFLGIAILTAADLPQDFDVHSKWISMTHNPDLPPNPKGKPEIRVEFQWVQLATKSRSAFSDDSDKPKKGTMSVHVVQCSELYAGQGKKGKKMRPSVSITVGEQTKHTAAALGRNPTWSPADKAVFHGVDPSFVMSVHVTNNNNSLKAKIVGMPKELGSLEIPVSTFVHTGKLTETYNLEHKSGKGKITLSVVWREIVSPQS